MKILSIQKYFTLLALVSICSQALRADCYAHTIFVPRQLSYNPIYEDALVFDEYAHMEDNRFLLSVKPIYTQTVRDSLSSYFNINHKCFMNVQENGSGDIDSLWFEVISSPDTFYSSRLSFSPKQQTYGAMLYFAWMLPRDFALTFNTAFIKRKNNIHICESNINSADLGQVPGFATVTQALASSSFCYGRVCGDQSKAGVDDLQIKILKNFTMLDDESLFWDLYALVGVPTGHGSKAHYLFEPLVGSKHAQFGLGFNIEKSFDMYYCDHFSLYGEFKWRYGFKGKETRSFDMTPNGQWSRYMLFTTPTSPADPFFAINNLTFKAQVTPRSSFDVLVAAHSERRGFSFEVGYNFWYRQAERVCPCICLPEVGIADLVGIAEFADPITTSSMATISEGVYPNEFQMPRDASYTLVTAGNINACSGAQPASSTNGVFGSFGYQYDRFYVGLNVSYENAANRNSASIVSAWANIDVCF
jgi:hypothetical protein